MRGLTPKTKTNLWGRDLSNTMQGAGGVGGLLMTSLITNNSVTNNFFPCYDGNGNVTEYIDQAAAVTVHFDYDAFGNITNPTTNNQTTNNFKYRFSTKPLDPATGLYYYGYRYFDPTIGRWTNRDPIAEMGGVNLNGFIANNSQNEWDLLGLCGEFMEPPSEGTYSYLEFLRWLHKNSNMNPVRDMAKQYRRGCVGVVAVELGLSDGILPLDNCYNSLAAAKSRMSEMEKNKECGCLSPAIFGVKGQNNVGLNEKDKDISVDEDGKVDLSNWDWEGLPGYINFDFAFLYWNGTCTHANHRHYKDPSKSNDGKDMEVYVDQAKDWEEKEYPGFNFFAWCVACDENGGITTRGWIRKTCNK